MSIIGKCEKCGGETVDYTCANCQHERIEELEIQLPTPETHRYVGMWRPPWSEIEYAFDGCGVRRSPVVGCCKCGKWNMNIKDSVPCWLAGHFDVPQYEVKKKPLISIHTNGDIQYLEGGPCV